MSPELLQTRQRLEGKIEELIGLLDFLDGDCDLEENGDLEPSLGSIPRAGANGVEYDLEFDDSDLEPSCGWTLNGTLGCGNEEEEPNGDEIDSNFSEDGI